MSRASSLLLLALSALAACRADVVAGITDRTSDGAGQHALAFLPDTHDFGPVPVTGESTSVAFALSNDTSTDAEDLMYQAFGDLVFKEANCTPTLLAGRRCYLVLAFNPRSLGPQSGELRASSRTHGSALSTLMGQGIKPDPLFVSPPLLDFDVVPVGQVSGRMIATIHNTSATTFEGLAVVVTGADAFTATSACSATLAPMATCTVDITMRPAAAGALAASLDVTTAGGLTAKTSLRGAGGAAP
jgi:hypothetical protein